MAKESIDIAKTVQEVERLLATSDHLSPALEAAINMVLVAVKLLADRLNLTSRYTASDPNREKKKRVTSGKPRSGQQGHPGCNLQAVDDPDEIQHIRIDRRTLPPGHYVDCGYESRQRFDIRISRHLAEYRAQVLKMRSAVSLLLIFQKSSSEQRNKVPALKPILFLYIDVSINTL